MKKTVTLKSGEPLELECNAASRVIFKRHWDENLLTGFQTINQQDTDALLGFMEKVVYTFAKNAELGTVEALKTRPTDDDFAIFLSRFEILELASENIINTVTDMWGANMKTESQPKNQ